MRFFLLILCGLSFLGGAMTLADAKSAIHEIEAYELFLIAAVFLVGAAIVEAIHSQREATVRKPRSRDLSAAQMEANVPAPGAKCPYCGKQIAPNLEACPHCHMRVAHIWQ